MPDPDAPELMAKLKESASRLRRAACDNRFKRIPNERILKNSRQADLDQDTRARINQIEPQLKEWVSVTEEIAERKRAIKRAMEIPEQGFSGITNFGDICQITDNDLEQLGQVDVLEGGPPCQAFSVAGLRQGLRDKRGNLSLEFCRLAERMKEINGTRYIIFENVPGTLSDKDAFGSVLAALVGEPGGQLFPPGRSWPNAGYVLGVGGRSAAWRILNSSHFVPQRRRRLFVVVDLRGNRSREILFEPECGFGDPGPRSSPRPGPAGETGNDIECPGRNRHRAEREETPGRRSGRIGAKRSIRSAAGFSQGNGAAAGTIGYQEEVSPTLKASSSGTNQVPAVLIETAEATVVRKLTPRECERLQGFPDDWTHVPARDGKLLADLSRYTTIGNAMTVPVIADIGKRLMTMGCEQSETPSLAKTVG
jgi:DNA (cytosine-5)-methyltransferase 1